MDIGILAYISGPDILKGRTGVFTEIWSFKWSPAIDVKLIKLNLYGSTIDEASRNMLVEETQKSINNFDKISQLYYNSILMGFKTQSQKMYKSCEDSLDNDDNFISLSIGFSNLLMLFLHVSVLKQYEKMIPSLKTLIERAYFQLCHSIPNYINPPDELTDPFVTSLKNTANILVNYLPFQLSLNTFINTVEYVAKNTSSDYIAGCSVGVLHLMNIKTIKDVKNHLNTYMLSTNDIKIKTGEFIRGLINICQSKILINEEIIKMLSDLVSSIEWEIFTGILPSLRKTFADLEKREYEIFAEKLAEFYGLRKYKFQDIVEDVKDDFLALFLEADKKTREIYENWFGELN